MPHNNEEHPPHEANQSNQSYDYSLFLHFCMISVLLVANDENAAASIAIIMEENALFDINRLIKTIIQKITISCRYCETDRIAQTIAAAYNPVSYTHLTLPTIA